MNHPLKVPPEDKSATHDAYCLYRCSNIKCEQVPGDVFQFEYRCPSCGVSWWPSNVEWRPKSPAGDIYSKPQRPQKEIDYLDINRIFST